MASDLLEAIVVMGPSGSGKSTLAQALAARTGGTFIEGDKHHPPANIRKLSSGVALTDADRGPFLDSIGRAIADLPRPAVVSCSALRRAHRDRLRSYAENIAFVWIDVPAEELARRLSRRRDHFMAPSLLPDQLATLEPPSAPERYAKIDGTLPTATQVDSVLRQLNTAL